MKKAMLGEIRLLCIGDARIITPAGEIDPSAEIVFAAALYLILERREHTGRKRLQALLWPEARSDVAAHRLRQTLFKLRRLGFAVEPDGKSRIFLNAKSIITDFERFERSGGTDPAIESAALPLFASFVPSFSSHYAEWLDGQRSKIGAVLGRVILGQIGRSRLAGNWVEVEKQSRALLRHAPENEEATLALAESLAMRGDKLQGVRILDAYLAEVGGGKSDLRISANTMRKRIVDRMPPRASDVPFDIPLLGREEYLEKIVQLLSKARNEIPQAVILCGDPGIGKSRLVSEFLAFASLQGVSVHRIYCRSSDSKRPLSILLELIPLLRGMRGAIGSAPDTLAFLEALTTHRPNSSKSGTAMHVSEPAQSKLDLAFADIIDAVTDECPVVLAIEDCQWIDDASAIALERLISRLQNQRILFLFTSRFVEGSPMADLMPRVAEVRLPGLLDEPSAEIVRTIARQSGRQVDDEYLRWCTTVAEGNPFFLHELASHWVETGNEHAAPPSLTAVLRQRLSRLSPNAIQILQTCALLENHATVDNVEAVLGYPAHEQLRCINELAGAGMVSIQQGDAPSSDGGRISSRHDLLSDTALMQLAAPARTYLHRRAAKVLETRINDTRDASTLWSCAKHWQLAGDGVQAFRLANSCANHLLEAGLPSEAADAFSRAIEYCANDANLLTVLEGQATAHYRSSNWVQVVSLVGQARTIKDRLFPDLGSHDDLELMLRRAEWQTMNWDHILTHSLNCLAADGATPAHRLEAGVMALMLLSLHGDRATGTAAFERMQKLGESADVAPDLMLQAKMIFNTSWGSLNDAVDAATALVVEQKKKRDIGALFRSLCNAGITLRVVGRFDDAREYFREALTLAESHRIYLSKSQALPMLAHLAIEQGRWDDARVWLNALRECPAPVGDRMIETEIGAIQARLSLVDGKFSEARRLVENDLIHMRVDQLPHRRAYWSALKVAVELATDGIASSESLDELEREHLQTRGNIFQAFASFALYVGLVSKGNNRKAKTFLNEYMTIHRREPWPAPPHLLDSLTSLVAKKPKAARAALHPS